MTTVARRPRGTYAKTAGRRTKIVEAAAQVFSGSGFHKASIRDVADLAGMSQAGVLHHYPSKEHLLEAVLEWRDDRSLGSIGEALEGLDALRSLVRLIEQNAQTPGLVELHVVLTAEGTSNDHPLRDYFERRYVQVIEFTRKALDETASDGHIKPGVDLAGAARCLIALMDGLQIQWLLDRNSVNMADEVRRYLQGLLTVDL